MKRKRNSKDLSFKKNIHLFCEGDTETCYFNMLKQKYGTYNLTIRHLRKSQPQIKVKTMNLSGLELLRKIQGIRKQSKIIGHADSVYAVFDRDNHQKDELRQCQKLAQKNDIKIIFSSSCFETWILMHFESVFPTADYSRFQLFKKLSGEKYFDCRHCKDKEIQKYEDIKGTKLLEFKDLLIDKVQFAKNNADKLYQINNDMINDNPYTDVGRFLPDIFKIEEF